MAALAPPIGGCELQQTMSLQDEAEGCRSLEREVAYLQWFTLVTRDDMKSSEY